MTFLHEITTCVTIKQNNLSTVGPIPRLVSYAYRQLCQFFVYFVMPNSFFTGIGFKIIVSLIFLSDILKSILLRISCSLA